MLRAFIILHLCIRFIIKKNSNIKVKNKMKENIRAMMMWMVCH